MSNQVNVQGIIDMINSQPDPYPAVCGLVYLLLDRTHIDSESKQDVLSDISDVFDGIPPSARSGITPVLKTRSRSPKRKAAAHG